MRYASGAQRLRQVEGRTVVNQAAIFGPKEDAVGEVDIGARAIDEGRACLRGGRRRAARIEHDTTHAGFCKRREAMQWMTVYISRGRFMLIRLHSQGAGR